MVSWTQALHIARVLNGPEISLPFLLVACCSGRPCFFPVVRAARARLLPRRVHRSSATSFAPCTARQSLQQSIPNVSPTATNQVSPGESSLCTSPTPIVANDSVDLFKLTHGGGASSSRLPVCRLDGDLAAANSRSVPISVHGMAEVRSMISSFFRPMLATEYYRT